MMIPEKEKGSEKPITRFRNILKLKREKDKTERVRKMELMIILIAIPHFALALPWIVTHLILPKRVAACQDLPQTIPFEYLKKKFGKPLYERKIGKYKWVYFKSDPFKSVPINARVIIKTGRVVELKCLGDGSSEWILDSR